MRRGWQNLFGIKAFQLKADTDSEFQPHLAPRQRGHPALLILHKVPSSLISGRSFGLPTTIVTPLWLTAAIGGSHKLEAEMDGVEEVMR